MFLDENDISRHKAKLGYDSFGTADVDRNYADFARFEFGMSFLRVGPNGSGLGGKGNVVQTLGLADSGTASNITAMRPSCAGIIGAWAVLGIRWAGLGCMHETMPLSGVFPGDQHIVVIG